MKKLISLLLVLAILSCLVILAVSCRDKNKDDDNPYNLEGAELEKYRALNSLTFQEYDVMTAEQREAHYNGYIALLGEKDGPEAYFDWYNAALKKYNDEQNREVIDGDTEIII